MFKLLVYLIDFKIGQTFWNKLVFWVFKVHATVTASSDIINKFTQFICICYITKVHKIMLSSCQETLNVVMSDVFNLFRWIFQIWV